MAHAVMRRQAEQISVPVNQHGGGFRVRREDEFAAAKLLRNRASESQLNDERRGIASHSRHVAPALLLC
jgi:hypothetical protein